MSGVISDPAVYAKWMKARIKHGCYIGGKETPEHYIWRSMIARCENKNAKDYPEYGGRGIKVCARWHVYAFFAADMGPRPARMSLERRNNNSGYKPSNCYWATRSAQGKNKRSTWWYEKGGVVLTLTEWADALGISASNACWRWKTWGTFEKGKTWRRQNLK